MAPADGKRAAPFLSTSLVVVPPEPLRRRIEKVRGRFASEWSGRVEGHVSLTRPFPKRVTPQQRALLTAAFGRVEPFVARTTRIEEFRRRSKGPASQAAQFHLVLAVEPAASFQRLHEAAIEVLGAETAYEDFRPHVTLGHFVSEAALREGHDLVKGTFPTCEFLVDEAKIVTLDADTGAREESVLRLGRGVV